MRNKMDEQLEIMTNDAFKDLDIKIKGWESLPPFYNQVNWLFNKATKGKYSDATNNATAEELSAQIKSAKKSAAKWGGICTAMVTEGGYALAEKIAPYHFGHNDFEWKILGLTALVGGVIYYSNNFKQWNEKFPVYMAGMKATTFAYSLTTVADMVIRYL
jgi:hypothetical protein